MSCNDIDVNAVNKRAFEKRYRDILSRDTIASSICITEEAELTKRELIELKHKKRVRKLKIIFKKALCFIIGHKWLYMEAIYEGELDGRWCERCDKEEGKRI